MIIQTKNALTHSRMLSSAKWLLNIINLRKSQTNFNAFIVILCAKAKYKVVHNYPVEGKRYEVLTGFRNLKKLTVFSALLFTPVYNNTPVQEEKWPAHSQNSFRHEGCIMMLWRLLQRT